MEQNVLSEYEYPSRENGPRWLDLSQVDFNPYFLEIYSHRVQLKLGRCEISMSPPLDSPRALSSSVACGFRDLVRNMFLIQPPCKALSIYMPDIDHDWCLNLITKVQDADGICVGHLLSQLDNHFGQAIEKWHTQASTLRKAISKPDWIELSDMGCMPRLWNIPGWPKLAIRLGAFEKSTQTLAH